MYYDLFSLMFTTSIKNINLKMIKLACLKNKSLNKKFSLNLFNKNL